MNETIAQYITPEFIAAAAAAATGLSVVFQPLKKWLALESDKVIELLYTTLVVVLPFANWFAFNFHTQSPDVVAIQSAFIALFSSPAYRLIVKPATAWVKRKKDAKDTGVEPAVTENEFAN